MTGTILILGGTREAADLARALVADRPGRRVITALAGRTKEPGPVAGEVRIGGFGGADGLARYLRDQGVTQLIDATHPYAKRISRNAIKAAEMAGVPLEICARAPWEPRPGDDWIAAGSEAEAAALIPPGARVFLALGSQHLAPFAARKDAWFLVRMVDAPPAPLPLARHALVTGKPGDAAGEGALLRAHAITVIVCRNSGGEGAYGKIEAARALGIAVIMIGRPNG